jgi:hypothetical protein
VFEKFAGVNDKFSTGTPAVPVANLSPVSLTPVAHLDLRISPRIFEKFEMTLMLFSGAWGKLIYDKKKTEVKHLVTLSLLK